MRLAFLTFLLLISSNIVLGNTTTLTVYLGDKIIAKTSEFKSPEHCDYFANRLNRHNPIMNKYGKLTKMKAYCNHENNPTTDPLLKPTHHTGEYLQKDINVLSAKKKM